jgi:hypothetical protein
MLRAAFVRTVGQPDRIYVTRSDGSEVSWPFPTYGEGLPHDLVHLVVESAFGVSGGFWGRVDGGADPKRVNDEANRRGGRDKYAAFGPDLSELYLAEALAAVPWYDADQVVEAVRATGAAAAPGVALPDHVREVRTVLSRLVVRWRSLKPKGALNLAFRTDHPRAAFDDLRRELALTA